MEIVDKQKDCSMQKYHMNLKEVDDPQSLGTSNWWWNLVFECTSGKS